MKKIFKNLFSFLVLLVFFTNTAFAANEMTTREYREYLNDKLIQSNIKEREDISYARIFKEGVKIGYTMPLMNTMVNVSNGLTTLINDLKMVKISNKAMQEYNDQFVKELEETATIANQAILNSKLLLDSDDKLFNITQFVKNEYLFSRFNKHVELTNEIFEKIKNYAPSKYVALN
jgi:hypothetical protein